MNQELFERKTSNQSSYCEITKEPTCTTTKLTLFSISKDEWGYPYILSTAGTSQDEQQVCIVKLHLSEDTN